MYAHPSESSKLLSVLCVNWQKKKGVIMCLLVREWENQHSHIFVVTESVTENLVQPGNKYQNCSFRGIPFPDIYLKERIVKCTDLRIFMAQLLMSEKFGNNLRVHSFE